ncbi:MAG: hypothetical protein JRL30_02630, partial [Deltaproteobacteria bacterium]|nr:hypothetical protein [Deltaproteobacteria bacterium]
MVGFLWGGKGKAIFILLLAFFPLFNPDFSQAEAEERSKSNELLAIGAAPVIQGNSALAKKKAIHQALIKGVEDYIVHLLGTQGAVNNFDRVTEEIIPSSQEDVENFHILAENQVNGNVKVLVRLRVNEDIIRERLRAAGTLITETPAIKVLFMVSETEAGDVSYWWEDTEEFRGLSPLELALHKVFQNRGFIPINRTLSPPEPNQVDSLISPDLADEDILKWGRLFSADVVICGRSHISDEAEISLTLRALDVSQGIQVCQAYLVEQMEQDL